MVESTSSIPSPDTTDPSWVEKYYPKSAPKSSYPSEWKVIGDSEDLEETTSNPTSFVPEYLQAVQTKNNILIGLVIAMAVLVGFLAVSVFFDQWRNGS